MGLAIAAARNITFGHKVKVSLSKPLDQIHYQTVANMYPAYNKAPFA